MGNEAKRSHERETGEKEKGGTTGEADRQNFLARQV